MHSHAHLDNQPRWFVLLTLMLIETPCSRVWQRLATVVMMDQQSKNDVKKGFVMHQRGRACVEAADIQNPTWHWRWAATTMNDPPLLRAAQRDCNAVIPNTISHQWQEKSQFSPPIRGAKITVWIYAQPQTWHTSWYSCKKQNEENPLCSLCFCCWRVCTKQPSLAS